MDSSEFMFVLQFIGTLMVIAAIGFWLANMVFKRLRKANKNPWPWSIVTFVLTTGLILGGLFVYFLTTLER